MTTRILQWLALSLLFLLAFGNAQPARAQYQAAAPIHPVPNGFAHPYVNPYGNQSGYPQMQEYRPNYVSAPMPPNTGNQVLGEDHGTTGHSDHRYHEDPYKLGSVDGWFETSGLGGTCRVCGPNPCACWTISGGALAWHRSTPRDDLIISDGVDVLRGGEFGMGWASGFEVGAIRHNIIPCWDLVVRGMYVDGWSAHASGLAILPPTQIETNPPTPIAGLRDVTAQYSSEFASLEVMARRRLDMHNRFSWLVGFRMIYMADDMAIQMVEQTGAFPTVYYNTSTRNHLYGPQAGFQWDVYCGPKWDIQTWGALGIYGNNARTNSHVFDDAPIPVVFTPSGREARFAFSSEIGVSTRYHLTENVALRADYRVLWIDGLAVASEQVNATSLDLGGIRAGGDVFYHGAFLGFDITF